MENEVKAKTWDVIGHQPIIEALQRHLETGKVNHAYLFVGPEAVGKKKVATEFAKALCCQGTKKPGGGQCQCQSCLQIEAGTRTDVVLIETAKGKIGIPRVRAIQHHLSLKSYAGGYKICIIDGVDHFTLPAANAILKILEEPTEQVVFILLAESIKGIIPTIVSRCVVFNFNLVSKSEIEKSLSVQDNSQPVVSIARSACGRPGLAIRYMNNGEELARRQERWQELRQILGQDLNKSFQLINSWKVKNEQALEFIKVMTAYFRDLAISKARCSEFTLDERNAADADQFSDRQVKDILSYLITANGLLSQNINPKLVIENFVLMLHHDEI